MTEPRYDDNDRGAIWKNDRKERETQPDFRGSAKIDGVEYWVSAWKRRVAENPAAPALRFSVQRKQPQVEVPPPVTQSTPAPEPDLHDDIPF